MPRPIWSGTIAFGLVSIPVKVFPAIEPQRLAFHELEEGTGHKVRHKRVVEGSNKEVPWKNIVKGFELSKGRFVALTKEELDAAAPEKTHAIDVEQFVALEEIDPVSWDQTYYVVPASPGAERSFALFREAMRRAGRVAIGRFVMRTKEYLVALRPYDNVIALQTMYFPAEVRNAKDLPGAPRASQRAPERELQLATQIIDSLTDAWKPSKYQDTFRERVLKIVRKKAKGEVIVAPEAPPPQGEVVDLMAALKASLGGAQSQKAHRRPRRAPRRTTSKHGVAARRRATSA